MRIFLFFCLGISVLGGVGSARATGQSVDDLLSRLTSESAAARAAGLLAEHLEDPRVLPALKGRFLTSTDQTTKQSIALVLVRSKAPEQAYFEYLAALGQRAVDDDAPSVYVLKGRQRDAATINPDFEAWCVSRGLTLAQGIEREEHLFQIDLMVLALAQDERSAPIFRKGLESKNPLVVDGCLMGLAALGDSADIPAIIATAALSPVDVDRYVAEALARYKAPRAKAEIEDRLRGSRLYDEYVGAVKLFEAREKLANEGRQKRER